MADTKISALPSLAGSALVADDIFPVVDTSATTTKGITAAGLRVGIAAQVGTVVVTHANGTGTVYAASADTDAARGTALLAAVASLVAGDHLMAAPGDYKVGIVSGTGADSLVIVLPSGVTFEGSGYGSRIYLDGTINTTTYTDISIITNSDTSGGNTNIAIRGWYLDGNNTSLTNASHRQRGIKLTKCEGCIIENNWIKHFGRIGTTSCIGIQPTSCTDCIITGNIMDDCVDGINTSATDPADTATHCLRLTISNNVVLGTNRDYAFNAYSVMNSVYVGNIVKSSNATAFHLLGCSNCLFTGNQVFATVAAGACGFKIINSVQAGPPLKNTIIGNTVRGCAANGVLLDSNLASDGGNYNRVLFNDLYGASGTADLLASSTPTGTVIFGNLQSNSTVGAAPSY
jgi:hypothetical protein